MYSQTNKYLFMHDASPKPFVWNRTQPSFKTLKSLPNLLFGSFFSHLAESIHKKTKFNHNQNVTSNMFFFFCVNANVTHAFIAINF